MNLVFIDATVASMAEKYSCISCIPAIHGGPMLASSPHGWVYGVSHQ